MLLFQDTLKLIDGWGSSKVCVVEEDGAMAGGVFLGLPLKRGNNRVCSAGPWQLLCQQLMLALVTSEDMRQQQGWFRMNRLFEHVVTVRLERDLLSKQAKKKAKNAHLFAAQAAHDVSACSNQSWAADLERTAHSVAAVAPDAPYAELEAALAGMCPAQRLRVLQITGCLVDRARRVEKTILEVGCDGVIRQAFDRLDQLSHVLFMDTANFALEHVFEMASRGADLKANQRDAETTQEAKAMADRQASEGGLSSERSRTNVALTHVPYIESEIEPFNRCSNRFCAYHDVIMTNPPLMRCWQLTYFSLPFLSVGVQMGRRSPNTRRAFRTLRCCANWTC